MPRPQILYFPLLLNDTLFEGTDSYFERRCLLNLKYSTVFQTGNGLNTGFRLIKTGSVILEDIYYFDDNIPEKDSSLKNAFASYGSIHHVPM